MSDSVTWACMWAGRYIWKVCPTSLINSKYISESVQTSEAVCVWEDDSLKLKQKLIKKKKRRNEKKKKAHTGLQ